MLYALVVGFGFFAISTYLRFKELELKYARLARAVALAEADRRDHAGDRPPTRAIRRELSARNGSAGADGVLSRATGCYDRRRKELDGGADAATEIGRGHPAESPGRPSTGRSPIRRRSPSRAGANSGSSGAPVVLAMRVCSSRSLVWIPVPML